MMRLLFSVILLAGTLCGCTTTHQTMMNDLTPELMSGGKMISDILAAPEPFRAQILVAEVVTNRHGKIELHRHGYRVDAEYFYPASSIKLCAAVAALQTIERLQPQAGIDLIDVPLEITPLFPGDAPQVSDASNVNGGQITVAHEMRKLALVSDNLAFNRFYDLIGHEELNRAMHAAGLKSLVINHRLSETRTIPDMSASASVTFRVSGGQSIVVPARKSSLVLTNHVKQLLVADSYMKGNQLVKTPMDFTSRNGISIRDLQDLLVKVARPDIDMGTPGFNLNEAHRARLLQAMTEYPRESANPIYAEKDFPDEYSKFLLPGIRRVFPSRLAGERIESSGKIGRAYGFSIENSYVRNPANGRAVFVTAVLYTNADGVLNDDKYEYETVADPFFADLGEVIAQKWLK